MSEKVLEKATEAGVNVVGGVGGVTDPAAGDLGTFAGGVAPGIPDVFSGDTGGGVLQPEQSRQFIDYIWDSMVWAKEGRRVTLRANTAELNKIGVGQRIIKKAAQADGDYTNADVAFTKVELTTTKVRLDWEVSTEALEDNLEGAALEDHIARLMAGQFASDLEDLAINADAAQTTAFEGILGKDGFHKQYTDAGNVVQVGTDSSGNVTVEDLQALIIALPRKFRGIKQNLRFYCGTGAFASAVNGLGSSGALVSEQVTTRVIDGAAPQTVGAPVRYRALGIPLVEVPLLGTGAADAFDIILTFPENNIWGFQRDITVHREFKPKKDTTEYTVYARFGIAIEETNAASVGTDQVIP
jgi:HK97 family phage major capsid protein